MNKPLLIRGFAMCIYRTVQKAKEEPDESKFWDALRQAYWCEARRAGVEREVEAYLMLHYK